MCMRACSVCPGLNSTVKGPHGRALHGQQVYLIVCLRGCCYQIERDKDKFKSGSVFLT